MGKFAKKKKNSGANVGVLGDFLYNNVMGKKVVQRRRSN